MPEKKFNTDKETSAQARKINSMANTLSKLETKVEGQKQIVSTTNKVLQQLANAVETTASSIEKVASSAIRYTKETLNQYSKQIAQDISINKKNLMALSITQASPVFGYFVSKFFETDIFQRTMQKIKDSFITGLKSVVDKVRGMILGTWGGLKRMVGLKKEPFNEKIPKMAKGGYVSKGGMTRLHAAEVVMPIDKLLDRIDEKIDARSENKLDSVLKKFGDKQEEANKNFITATKESSEKVSSNVEKLDKSNRTYNREIVDSLSEIRGALGGFYKGVRAWIGRMFRSFLMNHPAIKAVYNISNWFMGKVRGLINFPFTKRGGYKKFLSKDPNAFNATRDILGTTFVFSMDKYDTMIQLLTQQLTATQDMASAITGKKYKTTLFKTYKEFSIAGALARGIGRGAKGIGKIAAWEYRGVKKMMGKGGKTGAKVASQEVSLSNITDKFGLLLDVQIKMLYTLKKCCSNIAQNKESVEKGLSDEKTFQKKLLKEYYVQNKETKKTTGFLKHIRNGISDLGNKIKDQARKAGSYIWDAIKWLGGAIVGLGTTIWNMLPGWVKTTVGLGGAAYLGTEIGKAINKVMPDIVASIKAAFSKEFIKGGVEGGKTREEFKLQDKMEKIKEKERVSKLPFFQKMNEKMKWTDSLSKFQVPGQEELTTFERGQLNLIGLGSKVWRKVGIDPETQIRNQVEQIKEMNKEQEEERKYMGERLGKRQLKEFKKIMSPAAFELLDPEKPDGVANRFLYLATNSGIMQKDKEWLTPDEYHKETASIPQKALVKALEQVSSNLASQVKDVQTHVLKAEDARDIQNKNFADYMKGEMSSDAYKLLTKGGFDNISDRYSAMLLSNQLIKYKGKVVSIYEYLDLTEKLSFQDKMKYIFGLRNIPEKDILRLFGIQPMPEQDTNADINREILLHTDPTLLNIFGSQKYLSVMSPAQTMAVAQQAQINKDRLETEKSISSTLTGFGQDFMQSVVEHASEIQENYLMQSSKITENNMTPTISNNKIVGMVVKKESIKNDSIKKSITEALKNKYKNDAQYQEDLLKAQENMNRIMHGSSIGNRNQIMNVVRSGLNINNNSTSNVSGVGAGGGVGHSATSDPNLHAVITGEGLKN